MILTQLEKFRQAIYDSLGKAKDAVFELMDVVQLRFFGSDFKPVETRNFASLPKISGLTEPYCSISYLSKFNYLLSNEKSHLKLDDLD